MCSDHDQDFAYFCKDCSCLVCQECPVTTHKGHTLNQLKDIAAKTRKELQKNISKKQDSIAKLSALISNVEIDNMSFIRDECEKFKTSVKKIRDQLHETLVLICDEYIKSATDCFDLEKASLELSLKKLRKQHAQYTDVIAEMTRLSAEEYDPLLLVQHKSLPEVLDSLEAIPSGVSTPEGLTPISVEDVILKIAKEVKSTSLKKEETQKQSDLINALKGSLSEAGNEDFFLREVHTISLDPVLVEFIERSYEHLPLRSVLHQLDTFLVSPIDRKSGVLSICGRIKSSQAHDKQIKETLDEFFKQYCTATLVIPLEDWKNVLFNIRSIDVSDPNKVMVKIKKDKHELAISGEQQLVEHLYAVISSLLS